MFESTAPFTLFDYFRVPHSLVRPPDEELPGIAALGVRDEQPTLSWPRNGRLAALGRGGSYVLDSIPLFGRVVGDAQMRAWLKRAGGSWQRAQIVRDRRGTSVTAIW